MLLRYEDSWRVYSDRGAFERLSRNREPRVYKADSTDRRLPRGQPGRKLTRSNYGRRQKGTPRNTKTKNYSCGANTKKTGKINASIMHLVQGKGQVKKEPGKKYYGFAEMILQVSRKGGGGR